MCFDIVRERVNACIKCHLARLKHPIFYQVILRQMFPSSLINNEPSRMCPKNLKCQAIKYMFCISAHHTEPLDGSICTFSTFSGRLVSLHGIHFKDKYMHETGAQLESIFKVGIKGNDRVEIDDKFLHFYSYS